MPTWKKIVVSGSGISQLANDANYLADGGTFSASVDSRLDVSETLSASAHTQREAIKGLATTANNTLSSSIAPALRTEYVAGDSALSASAHTQREAVKGLATTANNSLSSSAAGALRTEYVAGDTALSASAHTQRAAIDAKVSALDSTYATDASVTSLSSSAEVRRNELNAALSASTHTQREAIKGLATSANNSLSSSAASALRTEYVAGDTALSSSAHSDRIAKISVLSASAHAARAGGATSASSHTQRIAVVNNLSSSAATALRAEYVAGDNALSSSAAAAIRTEYVAGDSALSASAHTQREAIKGLATTANNTLSGSSAGALRTEYVAGDSALSASQKTYIDAKVAGIVNSAPATLDTLDELAAALNDDPNFSASIATSIGNKLGAAYSSSAAGALRTEYKAGDTALSSSAHTQREAIKGLATAANNSLSSSAAAALRTEYVAGDSALSSSAAAALRTEYVAGDSALSASAHTDRIAKVAVLSASAHTARASGATSASAHAQRVAVVNTLSASAATANNSSAITVRNLVGQAVVATSFQGDGSNLSNITVDQNATVAAEFTGQTSVATDHNFGTKNVIVQVYNDSDEQIIPATVTSTNTNRTTVTFDTSTSGTIVIARGGHIVSGSVNSFGGQAPEFYAASASTHADRVAKISVLSASAHTQREAVKGLATTANNSLSSSIATAIRTEYVAGDTALSASAHTDRIAKVAVLSASAHAARAGGATSASAHTQRIAVVNVHSSSAATALRTEYKAADTALSSSQKTYIDAKVAGIVNSAPATLDTLDELAAALNDDPNFSASIATSIGNKLATSTHTAFSSSNASALRTEYVAADTALSSSQKTYIDAKVAGIVNSAPATLDTLDELAAALNDDPNFSASIATSIGNKLATSTHTAFSSSNASALRTEYVAGDTALSSSAHTQREAIKGLATTANNSLSSSAAGALRTEYKAGDTALSGALNTRIESLEAGGGTSGLSASAHTQREAIKGLATTANNSLSSSAAGALRTEYVAGDTALSSSAHTQREAIKGLATTANNSLSSSKSAALRTEYVAGDTALSSSAHTQREAIKGLATTANNSLSSSAAGAIRTEYVAGDSALSASGHLDRIAKVAVLSASAHTARGSISSQFTLAAGIGSDDTFNTGETLTFAGTGNEIETTVSNNQIQVGIVTNPTLTGNVTVTGDLIVTGDTIENQVTNLNIEDKFILLNSGSSTATDETGIIFGGTNGAAGAGAALVWNGDYNSNDGRLGVSNAVQWDASTATINYHLAGVFAGNASDAATAQADHVGNIRVDGDDIYIYSGS